MLGLVAEFVDILGVGGLRADLSADFSFSCGFDEGVGGADLGAQSGLGVEYDFGEKLDGGIAGRR